MHDFPKARVSSLSSLPKIALFLCCLVEPTGLCAQTISGTVQDPSGAVIAGAAIEITGGDLAQPIVLASDGLGTFNSPELKPGTYSVRVTREGFEPLIKVVNLQGAVELQLTLAVAKRQEIISVPGRSLAFANTDRVYRQLRDVGLGESFHFDNFTLTCDVATFQFRKGTLTFLSPVDGEVTGAIFTGEGRFSLKPLLTPDANELSRRTGAAEVNEDFAEAVFRFTQDGRLKFLPGLGSRAEAASEAATVLNRWRERMRQRQERPLGFTQYLLQGETMDNVDADVLSAVYNPAHPEFFNAYLRGQKHKDLRFFMRNRVGAVPQLDKPEEAALINYDPEG